MIDSYLSNIENILNNCSFIERFEINKQKINDFSGIISGLVFFNNGILDFLEVVKISQQNEPIKKKYKYHFRRKDNSLVFRYDNMPHYPNIDSFPHHKHTRNDIVKCYETELSLVIREIKDFKFDE